MQKYIDNIIDNHLHLQYRNGAPWEARTLINQLHCVSFRIKGFRGSGMRRVDDDHARQLQFVAKMQE
ncbi:TPA: hypothetical protein N2Z27_002077 [Escherichia coli]|nr:hypothetical protein [Escherichia coli]ELQ7855314.1 hypothetical protein [Escherichia coli]HBE7860073.1 hypothetical protein [Escherichia coli]HCL8291797.1 hypothetical protein [Escherichia coli]HCP0623140.1 hypothetical protein [Escherichia coli]